jgi:flagella basal body P-ring formation protein FlgA
MNPNLSSLSMKVATAAIVSIIAVQAVLASPVLKAEVAVAGKTVTVGDMFDGAGNLASAPLFLAPAPGTSGLVQIADIRLAASRAGIDDFDDHGSTGVEVSRLATTVDAPQLTALISKALKDRGVLTDGVTANAFFDAPLTALKAAAVPNPATLADFRYAPDSGLFAARFDLAGVDTPLDLTGRVDLMVEAPTLTETLGPGAILSAADIVMQPVSLKFADSGNIATIDQLLGKQLQRQSRAGMVLKITDVTDPQLIARSDLVTVYLHVGSLTLTVKGTALNAASLGQSVAVLNSTSKKIIHGTARADGAVEITTAPMIVAGL